MADFERPLANNSRTFNTSSPLYIPSPPLGRVWRRRSSEVGIFHSGDFAEYVSGGFVHFSSGDDIRCLRRDVLVLDPELSTGVVEVRTDELGPIVGPHN